jgi:hypothetical protein
MDKAYEWKNLYIEIYNIYIVQYILQDFTLFHLIIAAFDHLDNFMILVDLSAILILLFVR